MTDCIWAKSWPKYHPNQAALLLTALTADFIDFLMALQNIIKRSSQQRSALLSHSPSQAFKGVALGATAGGIQKARHVDGVGSKTTRHNAMVGQDMPVEAVVVPDLANARVFQEETELFHDSCTFSLQMQCYEYAETMLDAE